jgi:hypothetical protein
MSQRLPGNDLFEIACKKYMDIDVFSKVSFKDAQ